MLNRRDFLRAAKIIHHKPDEHLHYPEDKYTDATGRILVSIDGLRIGLHRLLWELDNPGDPLGDRFLIKQCDKFGCVNPNHYKVSHAPREYRSPAKPAPGPTSQELNRAKDQCPTGHPYSPENTYTHTRANGTTSRYCRTCRRLRNAARSRKDQPDAG